MDLKYLLIAVGYALVLLNTSVGDLPSGGVSGSQKGESIHAVYYVEGT